MKYTELPKQGNAATVPIPLIMEEGEAQNIAEVLLYSSWQERNVYNFKLPIKYAWLLPSDVIAISDGEKRHTMRIIKTKFESMSIQVMGVGYDPSIYKLSFPSTRSLMLKEYPPSHISKTIVEILHIKDNIASFTLNSEEENWKGATLFISYDDKNYKPIASANIQSTYGYVIEFTDEGITVVLRFGLLSSSYNTTYYSVIPACDAGIYGSQYLGTGMTKEGFSSTNTSTINAGNLALIGKEIIKFESEKLIGKNKYKLIGLIRGQEGTKKYEHTSGEKFILLDDSIISFEVQKGRKFYLKAVTYGDSLENTETKIVN